jgi:transcriptional regulator with XRE-family HTH domain
MGQIKNKELLDKIASKIKALREAQNLTQEEVINDTGINIIRIEMGINNMTISTLEALCKYFKTTLGEFCKDL